MKCELLAPAGSLSKLKMAFLYGADAVYAGGEEFSLRRAAENFSDEELKEGIDYAHELGKKVYIAANIITRESDLEEMAKYAVMLESFGADGIIISDLGAFKAIKDAAPNLPIHISTQANNLNSMTVKMWGELGAKRVVLARELSIKDIKEISKKCPDIELEAFVHGAMCISYSGRCLLSNYMASRDSNRGECAHPCRWNYALVEEKRPGEYMDVFENERGTFIFNSKDLCMINHIPDLIDSGLTSFKIEGRVKSEYYLACVVKAYRDAIDAYYNGEKQSDEWFNEILKVSHRDYCTGFFYGEPQQVYGSSSYIRNYDIVGYVLDYDKDTAIATVEQRNKFLKGDEIEILQPHLPVTRQRVDYLKNERGEDIDSAPHAMMKLKIKLDTPVVPNAILRKEL